ncbi:lantibiotic dehydratase [Rhizohabitans arisaemae]|uniref:lantibiotic dehydratase n=1 Tax=Rhizohabitans arisaemae TaxID=2720610 RepID=UPI0024B1674F|nr:lantibiotic dehydratase [Rhizohabitans arisaemae]
MTLYRHDGTTLFRATTRDGLDLPRLPDLHGDAHACRAWLDEVWTTAGVRRLVEHANPGLAAEIGKTLSEDRPFAPRRLTAALACYLLRWHSRVTPFGLFAGAAWAETGTEISVRFGPHHRATACADALWLAAVTTRLEACPDLLDRLTVVAATTTERGGRLVADGRPPTSSRTVLAAEQVTARITGPVRFVLDHSRRPIPFSDLTELLAGRYPATGREQIAALVAGLVTNGFLQTRLTAPQTAADALAHVNRELARVRADEVPEIGPLVKELRAAQDDLARYNRYALCHHPQTAHLLRLHAGDRMLGLCGTAPQPLAVTVQLDADVTVPAAVIGEAQNAADALLRLTPYPYGHPRWKGYHLAFRRRYGPGAIVPLADLVADSGLGLPADYRGSAHHHPPQPVTGRDHRLLALVQEAGLDGAAEIELDQALLGQLSVGDPGDMLVPPRIELAFRLHAATPADVRAGRFRLAVTGVPRPASSMMGRFAALGGERDRAALTASYAATSHPGAAAAQLSFPARRWHSSNVTRVPRLLESAIAVNEPIDGGCATIALDDLAVTSDTRQMYLLRRSTGTLIEPRVLHPLEAGTLTPPLARFLAELPIARCAVYQAFDWGAAARLPYLPRLRYGRTVLSPARWLLAAADLPGMSAPHREWESAFTAWRERARVPAHVELCQHEQRLPLDLGQEGHRGLLRERLHRVNRIELREGSTPGELGAVGRPHDFVLGLHATRPTPIPPPALQHAPARATGPDIGHLPGSPHWLHARVLAHPHRHDEIVAGYLASFCPAVDGRLWWWQRFRDLAHPDRGGHLSLYLELDGSPGAYGAAAARVASWAADLRQARLAADVELASYQPQEGRFGDGPAMRAAHQVFAADAAAAAAQIQTATRAGIAGEVLAAASMLDLALGFSATPGQGLRRLVDLLPGRRRPETRQAEDALRADAVRLANPHTGWSDLARLPGGADVLAAWARRCPVLAAYHRLHPSGHTDELLRVLLRAHHHRALGVDPGREHVVLRLVRAAALRQSALAERARP